MLKRLRFALHVGGITRDKKQNKMKTSTHHYKGCLIEGFNLRQLGDPSVRGMSYNVYRTEGGQSLSSSECLTRLNEAKQFIDTMIFADREHDREQSRQERASDDLLKDSGVL